MGDPRCDRGERSTKPAPEARRARAAPTSFRALDALSFPRTAEHFSGGCGRVPFGACGCDSSDRDMGAVPGEAAKIRSGFQAKVGTEVAHGALAPRFCERRWVERVKNIYAPSERLCGCAEAKFVAVVEGRMHRCLVFLRTESLPAAAIARKLRVLALFHFLRFPAPLSSAAVSAAADSHLLSELHCVLAVCVP